MGISIVIRCYNEEKYIGRLLDGISRQTIKDPEIIIVDSGSTDSTLQIASKYPIKLVNIEPKDFSFGRSLNLGCSQATKEFIVIPSAHVYPTYTDWLETLIKPFEDPEIALVYGKQRGDETTKFSEHQVLKKWFPDISVWKQRNPFCNNANAAIRQDLWQELPYDEDLTGLEDTDWAKKIMAKGYKISYSASSEIIHVHNESSSQTYNRYRREAIAMKSIFPSETLSIWDFVRLFACNVIQDWYEALRARKLMKNICSIFTFRLMQFSGARKGFKQNKPVASDLKQTFYYPCNSTIKSKNITESNQGHRIRYTEELS